MFSFALTRQPGPDFAAGMTTSTHLGQPDFNTLLAQHNAYEQTLQGLGLQIIHMDALLGYPDAYFVEDTAVVTPEVGIITHPGAAARQGEQNSIAEKLAQHRPLAYIQPPGTVEGGDIFFVGKRFYIGISERTNLEGARQLADLVARYGYRSTLVHVRAGLHLKSSANPVTEDHLLVTSEFANRQEFAGFQKLIIPEEEEYAANTLWINDHLVTPAGFPKTRDVLSQTGMEIFELAMSEAQKMDGGLTCMSLRF